jgi:hypothetical protein
MGEVGGAYLIMDGKGIQYLLDGCNPILKVHTA